MWTSFLSTIRKKLVSRFNFTYRYIDEFENYQDQMYPVELEIKDTTESNTSAFCLDLLLSIGKDSQLHTSIYDKRDDFIFHMTNFPFLGSNNISFVCLWRLYLAAYTIFSMLIFVEIVILWVYDTIPFGFSLFRHFWSITFQHLKLHCLVKDH